MTRDRRTAAAPTAHRHTPRPDGFLPYMAWAEAMGRTHDQGRCPTCELWVIWTPREEHEWP